jgi:hypothetical protein
MNPTVSIFVAATPLLASSGAEAARGTAGGSTNLMLPPTPPASTAQPHTNPIGGVFTDQGLGALPGAPGSSTYDPFGALPSLNNPGSPLAPTPGTSATGINTPSTSSGTTSSTTGGM